MNTVFKKFLLIAVVTCGFNLARADSIAYIVPEEVMSNSVVLKTQIADAQKSFTVQQNKLLAQIDKQQKKLDKKGLSSAEQEQIALGLIQLQNQYAELNKLNSANFDKIKNNYYSYIKKACLELFKQQNKYQYILNSNSVVVTDPKNDISLEVSKLADKLYQKEHK